MGGANSGWRQPEFDRQVCLAKNKGDSVMVCDE